MHSKAKVYPNRGTPYLQAWFQVWDSSLQKWKATTKSTKSTDPEEALDIAKQYEKVALAAGGPKGTTRLSREFVVEVINDILEISGHDPFQDQKTWKEYSDNWLKTTFKRVPKALTEGSWKVYASHVSNLNTWLGKDVNLTLNQFTADQVQDWYNESLDEGLAPTTLANTATTLEKIFERARDEGFVTRNPFKLLTKDSGAGNKRDAYTLKQMQTITGYLQRSKVPLHKEWLTVSLLAFCTSQRLGDCARATRSQFTIAKPFIIWTMTPSKTKRSKKSLRIPLVDPLADHVRQLLATPADHLFLTPSLAETPTSGSSGLSTQFVQILAGCGIQGRQVERTGKGRSFRSLSAHSMRHACNSLMANAGVPKDVRKLITGHADDTTNMTYTHLDDSTKAASLQKAFKVKPAKKAPIKKAS